LTSDAVTQLSTVPNYARLTQKEWRGVQTSTDSQYKKLLGNPPTRKDIEKKIENQYATNALQKLAMFLLLVLAVFTGFKVGALAVPFAVNLFEHLTGDADKIDSRIIAVFTIVSFGLFWLLSTPGLIYFKLLSHDARLLTQRENTKGYKWYERFSLEWISPRLPSLMTYVIMAWLFAMSIAGGGTIFEVFIPVLAELALAQLVGDILEQNAAYQRVISDRLRLEREAYEERLADKQDKERVAIMSGIMLETMMNVVRDNKKPNAFLDKAEKHIIKSVLSTEYERLTVVDNFVAEVEARNEVEPIVNTSTDVSSVVETPKLTSTPKPTTKRLKPPRGAKKWTVEAMVHALQVAGKDPSNYNERNVKQDFEPAYNATGVWRKGAKKAFTGRD
jgi:hypothetical protein